MLKKVPAVMAIALAAALWMLSGGALFASAQGSSVGSGSAAYDATNPVPAGSTFIPDGTTAADGTSIPDGSILLPAGSTLPDGTVVGPGTVLYPDGSVYVFSDAGSWPTGDMVPNSFVFAPQSLPFTGGNQSTLAFFGITMILVGGVAFAARKSVPVT